GEQLLLTNGFHRVAGAERNGSAKISAHIRSGTMDEAVLAAVRAGAYEGLKRTNKDKLKAVKALLATDGGSGNSHQMIADTAGGSQRVVSKLRRSTQNKTELPPTRIGKDGKSRSNQRRKTTSTAPPKMSPAQAIEKKQVDRVCENADFSLPAETADTE